MDTGQRTDLSGRADTDAVMVANQSDLVAALRIELAQASDEVGHLQIALSSSRRIGAAIGVLMSARKLSYDQSFSLLAQSSQHLNRKLHDVAEDVIETGTLP